jgi:hypothetical protein
MSIYYLKYLIQGKFDPWHRQITILEIYLHTVLVHFNNTEILGHLEICQSVTFSINPASSLSSCRFLSSHSGMSCSSSSSSTPVLYYSDGCSDMTRSPQDDPKPQSMFPLHAYFTTLSCPSLLSLPLTPSAPGSADPSGLGFVCSFKEQSNQICVVFSNPIQPLRFACYVLFDSLLLCFG